MASGYPIDSTERALLSWRKIPMDSSVKETETEIRRKAHKAVGLRSRVGTEARRELGPHDWPPECRSWAPS